jgi:hypothetical protein
MTELIAFLSTGKGTWANVSGLIKGESWDKVYLLTNDFGKEKFTAEENTELIVINSNANPEELRDEITGILKEKVKDEIAVNFISGSGKEHMALISALMKSGVGFRFVVQADEGIKEL